MYQNSHSVPASLTAPSTSPWSKNQSRLAAEVIVLVLEAFQPDGLLGSFQERLGLLGEREEPLRVPATDRVGVVRGREALAGELPDRLEHPEPSSGPPHEALVDQRLQPVDVSLDDLFGRVQRTAAREDREPLEELLLVVGEEVVRPLDRRAKRVLARFRIAAALQEIEALSEPVQDLRRREHTGAGRGELDREREVVEAATKLDRRVVRIEPAALSRTA